MTFPFTRTSHSKSRSGFTLAEVIISVGIAAIGIGGIVWGYIATSHRAEWTTCSAAAQQMAMRQLEQTRAAKWDPMGYPAVDQLSEGTTIITNIPLDLPLVGTTPVMATTVTTISSVPPNHVYLKKIRVDCSWSLMSRGPFTNTVITYRAPDQ